MEESESGLVGLDTTLAQIKQYSGVLKINNTTLLQVTIQGFSEKIEVLLIRILERIVRFELEKTRFHAIKNRVK